jgi:hypothetical protein
MTIRKILVASLLVITPLISSAASASRISDQEKMDEEFAACVSEWVKRGFPGGIDGGTAFCYARVYGGETTGGGPPERTYFD